MLISITFSDYGMDDRGSILGRGREFSSSPPRPDRSGAHPASHSMDFWVSFSGGKEAGAWNLPLTSI
jgi:hypothetical protein